MITEEKKLKEAMGKSPLHKQKKKTQVRLHMGKEPLCHVNGIGSDQPANQQTIRAFCLFVKHSKHSVVFTDSVNGQQKP